MAKGRIPEAFPSLVWVVWQDASYQRGEYTVEELTKRVELFSAGLLVCEDEETISLALDYCPKDETWRYIEHIPKVLVKRRGATCGEKGGEVPCR